MSYRIANIWPAEADRSDDRTPYGPPILEGAPTYCSVRDRSHACAVAWPAISDQVDPDQDRWQWTGNAACGEHWGMPFPPAWRGDPEGWPA